MAVAMMEVSKALKGILYKMYSRLRYGIEPAIYFQLVLFYFIEPCMSFPAFMASIPSAKKVPCPTKDMSGCTKNGLCEGVGHGTCQGGSLPLNPFGIALKEARYTWGTELCADDSDGDGWTNGFELGDPCCIFGTDDYVEGYANEMFWNERREERNEASAHNSNDEILTISHPGFYESIPTSLTSNAFFNYSNHDNIEDVCANYRLRRALLRGEDDDSRNKLTASHRENPFLDDEPQYMFRLQFPNVTIPPQLTSYACTFIDLAEYVSDSSVVYHMVGFKANIDNMKYMHHLLLKVCDGGLGSASHMQTNMYEDGCFRAINDAGTRCYTVFAGWNPGGWSDAKNGMFSFPKEAGLSIIGDGARFISVEAHYTNYNEDRNAFDASSMDFYMTDKLRNYNSHVAMLGPISGEVKTIKLFGRARPISFTPIEIPPHERAFELRSNCTLQSDITVWATRGHGHKFMRSIYVEHFPLPRTKRNDLTNQTNAESWTRNMIGVIKEFDYDFQPVQYVDKEGGYNFQKGDVLRTHCIYNTEQHDEVVYGGASTLDEMCINYIFYYSTADRLRDDNRTEKKMKSYGSFFSCIDWKSYETERLDEAPFV